MAKSGTAAGAARVRQMFGGIARRYDLANHALSCGIDFYWRNRAADMVISWRPDTIVDLATGTGDLALALQKKLPDAEVTGVDFLPEMLELAQRKGVNRTILADAMKLPLPDASFDCVTVAFGLRNMESWRDALGEMSRLLRAGGHLLVLEFSLPTSPIVRTIYRFYLHRCLPLLASLLTKRKSAYDYLGDSIEEFPSGRAMLDLIEASGFWHATLQSLSYGVATIYTAEKSPLASP
jgi:demethylmenaquinone methyltransferase / 2-methoxy-6-polyprenyl-1,4-benzoquinol methylase